MVVEDDRKNTDKSVERLMGNKPEARFEFIQERAEFASEECWTCTAKESHGCPSSRLKVCRNSCRVQTTAAEPTAVD